MQRVVVYAWIARLTFGSMQRLGKRAKDGPLPALEIDLGCRKRQLRN
jgi:hypothetical protein